MTVTSTFHMELVNYWFDTRYADIMSSRSSLYPREAFHRLASPQTSFGVRLSRIHFSCIHFSATDGFSYERVASPQTSFGVRLSRIHFSPRTSAKHSRHLRSPITGRLRIFVKRNPSRFLRSVRLLIECARNL